MIPSPLTLIPGPALRPWAMGLRPCLVAVVLLATSSIASAQTWRPPADNQRCPSKWGAGDQRGIDHAHQAFADNQAGRHQRPDALGKVLLVAAGFSFAIAVGEFGATVFVARANLPTMPVAIFRLLGRPGIANFGQAMAMSTILAAVTAAAILLIDRLRVGQVGRF